MGLFSGLAGKGAGAGAALDAPTGVMIPIVAVMLADGAIDDEEVRQIRSICAWSPIYLANSMDRDTEIIMRAIRIVEDHGAEAACHKAREALSPGLRETAFVSAVRIVFSDGHVGAAEQRMIENLAQWLQIDSARARMMIETVSIMQHCSDV